MADKKQKKKKPAEDGHRVLKKASYG